AAGGTAHGDVELVPGTDAQATRAGADRDAGHQRIILDHRHVARGLVADVHPVRRGQEQRGEEEHGTCFRPGDRSCQWSKESMFRRMLTLLAALLAASSLEGLDQMYPQLDALY